MNKNTTVSEYILEEVISSTHLCTATLSLLFIQKYNDVSLLFEPQIAKKALALLKSKDDELVSQLIYLLEQTSVDHIELKNNFNVSNISTVRQEEYPELLKAILNKKADIFNISKETSPKTPGFKFLSSNANGIFKSGQPNTIFISSHNQQEQLQLQNVVPSCISQQKQMIHIKYEGSDLNINYFNYPQQKSEVASNVLNLKFFSNNNKLNDNVNTELTDVKLQDSDAITSNVSRFVHSEMNDIFKGEENELNITYSSNSCNSLLSTQQAEQKIMKRSVDTNDIFIITQKPALDINAEQKYKHTDKCQVQKKLFKSEENNLHYQFCHYIQIILEKVDETIITNLLSSDNCQICSDVLLSSSQLKELYIESAKLKINGGMELVPVNQLIRLMYILEINVRNVTGVRLGDIPEKTEDKQKWMETCLYPVLGAVDAALCIFYIMSSRNMPKQIYLEELIDKIILFIKFQLSNIIFPHYSVTNSNITNDKHFNKEKLQAPFYAKYFSTIYNKTCELFNLATEIISIEIMTDNTILHVFSICLSPFFVENISEMQLSCLKLAAILFNRYEQHRHLFLEDILFSISRLPTNKHNLRLYQINSKDQIQMITALVLHIVQSIVILPDALINKLEIYNKDALKEMSDKYDAAVNIAGKFLFDFLDKCTTKADEIDNRSLFGNFIQDLLTAVKEPKWPVTELLINLLCNILTKEILNNNKDISLRLIFIDYLGTITANLQQQVVFSKCSMEQVMKTYKLEEGNECDDKDNKVTKEKQIKFIKRLLLNYIITNDHKDEVYKCARHFYIIQWYRDIIQKEILPNSAEKNSKKQSEKIQQREREELKMFYINNIRPSQETSPLQTFIDTKNAELISQYLNTERTFSKNFDIYFRTILSVLRENSNLIRIKAVKCLKLIFEADLSILSEKHMQDNMSYLFLDQSILVRETVVDLVGKFVLNKSDLIDKYYDKLTARIVDTGISVRKRVIRIFKEICIKYPEHPKVPNICVDIIKRVNDEEGVQKLIIEIFYILWFTPVLEETSSDKSALHKKIINITDVVTTLKDTELDYIEQLLTNLFKYKTNKDDLIKKRTNLPNNLLVASQQIVDYLAIHMLHLDEIVAIQNQSDCSNHLATCFITFNLFAKIRPQLLVKHASNLQSYLSIKCQSKNDYIIVNTVANCLELVIPYINHPSPLFLSQLEEDFIKIIFKYNHSLIISNCISCLASVINNITENYQLLRDCFVRYYKIIIKIKDLEKNSEEYSNIIINYKSIFKRALFITGLLLRYFDFTNTKVIGNLPLDVKNQTFHMYLHILQQEDEDIQISTLKAIGHVCIRYHEFMLHNELKKLYNKIFIKHDSIKIKSQLLQNIEMFLIEEENKVVTFEETCKTQGKKDSIKEIDDKSSMASTVVQLYLKGILTSYIHSNIDVRYSSLKVIQLISQQGLVQPVQIVPYLICMSSDLEHNISQRADALLTDINRKYPGLIFTKCQLGISLSYQLQLYIQKDKIIRGFSQKEERKFSPALNNYLYIIVKDSRQQRRSLVLFILKQFDEQKRTNLSYLLYLADNLAHFPYTIQDELLFVIHNIDLMISVSGTNLLQDFKEGLTKVELNKNQTNTSTKHDTQQIEPEHILDTDDEDAGTLIARLPSNTTNLQGCINMSQGYLMLLILKQYLKDTYGLNDKQILQYSPFHKTKIYDKTITRKNNSSFNPNAVLSKIAQETSIGTLDSEGRKNLIAQYLDFKQLMMKIDLDDLDDSDRSIFFNNKTDNTKAENTALTSKKKCNEVPAKIPKLVNNLKRKHLKK